MARVEHHEAAYRKPLGRVLVEMGALDEDQLEQMLAFQRREGRLLGEILVERGIVSQLALVAACAQQRREGLDRRAPRSGRPGAWKPLGQILIERRRIGSIQLQQALADQRQHSSFLGEILIRRGWITPAELVAALSTQLAWVSETDNDFYVRELTAEGLRTVHRAPTFLAASDFVFEEVLVDREPERLEIVRGSGAAAEVVWDYTPVKEASPGRADLLQVFRLLVSEWSSAEA